ncbi:esterase/lipase family protein [Salinibius halmophilus]|uniref:esterase/lipase family protein n=1 Tax=Salinibius halmophilus TaxID=1853216 RepID=UPI000E66AC00|nr:alpha/beta fold hydrolase [Salinibius halmophilus]
MALLLIAAPVSAQQVVLVHGIDDDASKFDWFIEQLSDDWQVTAANISPSDGSIDFETMAQQLDEQLPDGEFHLLGFSMGGIITRSWLQTNESQWGRVLSYTSLSAPNFGTTWADVCDEKVGCRQMRRDSEWLGKLNSDIKFPEHIPTLTIHTPLDVVIIPPDSTELPGAINETMWVSMHPMMVRNRDVLERVVQHWQSATN